VVAVYTDRPYFQKKKTIDYRLYDREKKAAITKAEAVSEAATMAQKKNIKKIKQ